MTGLTPIKPNFSVEKVEGKQCLSLTGFIYGGISFTADGNVTVRFFLNQILVAELLVRKNFAGRQVAGIYAFDALVLEGADADNIVFFIAHRLSWPPSGNIDDHSAFGFGYRNLFFACQNLCFARFPDKPFPEALALLPFTEALKKHFLTAASLEESFDFLIIKKEPVLKERLELIMVFALYSKLWGLAYIKKQAEFIKSSFWHLLSFLGSEAQYFNVKNSGLHDEVALHLLIFTALNDYRQLFDLLGEVELSIKARSLYAKRNNFHFPVRSLLTAALMLLANVGNFQQAAGWLHHSPPAAIAIDELYFVTRAFQLLNEKHALQRLLAAYPYKQYAGDTMLTLFTL
jgi:hypothetical protein